MLCKITKNLQILPPMVQRLNLQKNIQNDNFQKKVPQTKICKIVVWKKILLNLHKKILNHNLQKSYPKAHDNFLNVVPNNKLQKY